MTKLSLRRTDTAAARRSLHDGPPRPVRAACVLAVFLLTGCTRPTPPGPALDPDVPCEGTTTIRVTVHGLKSHDGHLRLALYADENGFPGEPERALHREVLPITEDTIVHEFADVPRGTYAVSVLHDEDANGEMKTDIFGRPTEGYGFSRDARGRMGPPSFAAAAVHACDEGFDVPVNLQY